MNFRASKLVTEQYGLSTTQYGWEDPREALPTNAPAATTDLATFQELQLVQNAEEMDCVPKPIIHSCARPASSMGWRSAATWVSYTNMIRRRTGSNALEEYQLDPMTKKIRRKSQNRIRSTSSNSLSPQSDFVRQDDRTEGDLLITENLVYCRKSTHRRRNSADSKDVSQKYILLNAAPFEKGNGLLREEPRGAAPNRV